MEHDIGVRRGCVRARELPMHTLTEAYNCVVQAKRSDNVHKTIAECSQAARPTASIGPLASNPRVKYVARVEWGDLILSGDSHNTVSSTLLRNISQTFHGHTMILMAGGSVGRLIIFVTLR